MFNKILTQVLPFPPEIELSSECKDLLAKLLEKDPVRRLGNFDGCNGVEAIKKHNFFRDIDWAKVRNRDLD